MKNFEYWKKSRAWDERFNCCTVPEHNNPHIYLAYWVKCEDNYYSCKELAIGFGNWTRRDDGFYNRWPERFPSGGLISWDELMGLGYLGREFPFNILFEAYCRRGFYDNEFPDNPRFKSFIYRFPHLIAYLKFKRDGRVNIFWSSVLAIWVLIASLSKDEGVGKHLRVWLIGKDISKMFLPRMALRYWQKKRIDKELDISTCFKRYFPTIPEFSEMAKEDGYL